MNRLNALAFKFCSQLFVVLLLCLCGTWQASAKEGVGLPASERTLHRVIAEGDEWFTTAEGKRIVDNIVTWQNANGGWWKKYNPEIARPAELPPADLHDAPPGDTEDVWRRTSTFDNDATHTELRIIARAARITNDEKYRAAFLHGLDFIFKSQYANGGWPQRFPLKNNYGRCITFNDGAMTRVMFLLRDIADNKPDYSFVPIDQRQKCREAFDRGVECILNCQVKQNGKLTAWAQQYDEVTLQAASARAYELPSITACESAEIGVLLMELEKPSERARQAIESAVKWYELSKITGKRVEAVKGTQYENGHDRVLVDDPKAAPIWARFYDLETNEPFFCSRDGVKRKSMSEISWERRNGYGWYGSWGEKFLGAYAKWKEKAAPAAFEIKDRSITVARDGSGDFKTVQAAVDSVAGDRAVVIHIKPGTYKDRIVIGKEKSHLTLRGDDAKTTILTFDRNARFKGPDGKEVGTFQSYSTRVDASDFLAENITFENTAGDTGQAVALYATGDRQIYHNCRMLGWQDTLYAENGRQYYKDCYVEGRVDFIFGGATAVFDHCEIHSKNGGHVTAARTPEDHPFGYVFLNCKLTGDSVPADLGRPWRPYAATVFIHCDLGSHIKPEGWSIWRGNENHKTARYAEFENTGPGFVPQKRLDWTRQLTADEAAKYTIPNILGGADHWNPQ